MIYIIKLGVSFRACLDIFRKVIFIIVHIQYVIYPINYEYVCRILSMEKC